jgi:hypothetical protein
MRVSRPKLSGGKTQVDDCAQDILLQRSGIIYERSWSCSAVNESLIIPISFFSNFRSRGHTNADTRAYWNSQWGSISLSGLYTTAVQNVASQISARAWQKEALQIGCVLATDCIALLAA